MISESSWPAHSESATFRVSNTAESDDITAINLSSLSLDSSEDPSGSSDAIDYNSMTVSELKAIAKERGITGYSSLTKAELIQALESGE